MRKTECAAIHPTHRIHHMPIMPSDEVQPMCITTMQERVGAYRMASLGEGR